MFISTLSKASKRCNQPSCPPVYKQLNKTWYTYPVSFHTVDHTVMKKDRIMPFSGKVVDQQIIM